MLTYGQIIAEGLAQAGRSDLTSQGRLWIKLFLERMYRNQDFGFLEKEASLALTDGVSIPSDYRAAIMGRIGDSRVPLTQIYGEQYAAYNTSPSSTGTPTMFYVDTLNSVVRFLPAPSEDLGFYLRYHSIPTLPDHTTSGMDSSTPVWGLSKDILVQAVYVKALEYNDDARFEKEEQKLMAMVNESKMNSRDIRGGSGRFKMGKSFGKRF